MPYTARHVKRYFWSSKDAAVDTSYCAAPSKYYRHHWSGHGACFNSVTISDPPATSANLDALLQEAWAEANTTGLQVLVDLAERKETLELFTTFRDRYTKRARKIHEKTAIYFKGGRPRKCSRGKVADFTSTFQDVWMEKRYGWDQLVYAAEDLQQAWLNWENPREAVFVEGKAGNNDVVVTEIPSNNVIFQRISGNAYSFSERKRTTTLKARAKVICIAQSVPHGALAAKGIVINPLSTIWEIVPYSFVADWFTNVGDIFAAHWPSAAFAGSTACVSTKWTDEVSIKATFTRTVVDAPQFAGQAEFSFSNTEYSRVPRSDVPLVLEIKPKITWKRVLDATALVRRFVPRSVERWARCSFT